MEFEHLEKMAIVKAVLEVMHADEKMDAHETMYLFQLSHQLSFNTDFMVEARQMDPQKAVAILSSMEPPKKANFMVMLLEMARADGDFSKEEMQSILTIIGGSGFFGD